MIAYLASAHGAPCPTLVMAAAGLPGDDEALTAVLTEVRTWLCQNGYAHVRKIALVSGSGHPLFDLDYRFVQVLSGERPRFDLRGNCGHSILAAVTVAGRLGWLPRLAPDDRVRVNVVNNDEHVVCEVDTSDRATNAFTVHFLHHPPVRHRDLLLDTEPTTQLAYDEGVVRVSMISAGNPYVFVDAADLGRGTPEALFADDAELFATMSAIRSAAAARLGWDPEGAFPKIAALTTAGAGELAARAITVPGWHPTLALTGATCLGAAGVIDGTIPHRLAREAGAAPGRLVIRTPGAVTAATTTASGPGLHDTLSWISISDKVVSFDGPIVVEPLRTLSFKEVDACLPLSTV